MQTLYEAPGVTLATYDRSTRTITVSWKALNDSKSLRECCDAQLKAVKQGARYLIIDVADAKGVVRQEDQAWFGNTLFPAFDRAGLAKMVNVLPKSALTKLSSGTWSKTASPFNFEIFEASSIDEAVRATRS